MKHAWFLLAGLGGLIAAAACGDDETTTTTTTTGAGGSGGESCGFMMSGGYGGFGDVCMDATGDDACVTCTRANCCAELQACEPDATCSCLLECFLEGCDPVACLQTCGQNDQVNALTQCATNCDPCLE